MTRILSGHPIRGKPAQMSPVRAADPSPQACPREGALRDCARGRSHPLEPDGGCPAWHEHEPRAGGGAGEGLVEWGTRGADHRSARGLEATPRVLARSDGPAYLRGTRPSVARRRSIGAAHPRAPARAVRRGWRAQERTGTKGGSDLPGPCKGTDGPTISLVLRDLKAEGLVNVESTGQGAKWRRPAPAQARERRAIGAQLALGSAEGSSRSEGH